MSTLNRVTEAKIASAIMRILAARAAGAASLAELKEELPRHLELAAEDRERSIVRPDEQAWEQQVRSLLNNRAKAGNPIHEGLLAFSPGHLAITAAGRARLGIC